MVVADIRFPFPGSVLNGKTQTQQQQKRETIFYHTHTTSDDNYADDGTRFVSS